MDTISTTNFQEQLEALKQGKISNPAIGIINNTNPNRTPIIEENTVQTEPQQNKNTINFESKLQNDFKNQLEDLSAGRISNQDIININNKNNSVPVQGQKIENRWNTIKNNNNGSNNNGSNNSGSNNSGSNNSGSNNSGSTPTRTPITATDYPEIVRKVIRGEFGNGQARKNALAQAGYDYNQVQSLVNDAMKGKAYSGGNISQPSTTNTQSVNPASTSNNYSNYEDYINNFATQQQKGYMDPEGFWHDGMSQNDFNEAYISGQSDIFNSRRNEVMNGGRTADQVFWDTLNKYIADPSVYNEQQVNALKQLATMLGYMDEKGNMAQQNPDGTYGYAINMDFANPLTQDQFYAQSGYGANQTNSVPQIQSQNKVYNNYSNGHWNPSAAIMSGQGKSGIARTGQYLFSL